MIDALKRKLGITPALPQAETAKENVTMDVKDDGVVAPATAETVDVVELQASLASKTAELTAATGKIAELTALVEAAADFHAAQTKAALEAKLDARKAKVIATVGTEKAEALTAATASMEDGAFDAVMAAMATTATAEAATPLFKEVGVEASADTTKLVTGNATMDYLVSKYKTKAA